MNVQVFDHLMNPIAVVHADVEGDSFTMSTDDPYCKEEVVRFGNFISVEGRTGILSFPREWEAGKVSLPIVWDKK